MVRLAVMGATGAVGREMLRTLEQRNFRYSSIKLLASERSAGTKLQFNGAMHPVELLTKDAFGGVDIVLSSAGASVSREFAPAAVAAGAVVIDNTSAFRMDKAVPLVVPEVNAHAAQHHQGIIANPNCSTIQLVVALKPLHEAARIKRVVVSTYQATSGAGNAAMDEMEEQTIAHLNGDELPAPRKFAHTIAFNCLPQIDVFLESGYTKEEMKMVNETQKIMEDDSIQVSPTCVRVPVYRGHSESVNIETEQPLAPEEARDLLRRAPGVVVVDDPANGAYPMPLYADGLDPVFVGRIRKDETVANGLNLWIVSDNLRKGAALNAVQIAELLIEKGWVKQAG
ncbi:MAG TPA: aspartate-semialdehyde dehydrogenase [Candidatus Sumerlaeota bacterium]|nr:aspartate-semialdehyde dehydrogenase [Candidatus Sumerlaeota bacterium]